MTLKSLTLDDLECTGVPIVRYCGYTVSYNNRHDIRRVRQSPYLRACSLIFWLLINLNTLQEILLDCDQSNVLLARIIFFCILLRAFSFLSACIKEPASS